MTSGEVGQETGGVGISRRCWLDVTSVFHALRRAGNRPTGISRVVLEVVKAARRDVGCGGYLGLVRFDRTLPGFREVEWEALDALLASTARPPPPWPPVREIARKMVSSHVLNLLKIERRVVSLLVGVRRMGGKSQSVSDGYQHPFRDGDVWINLGNWWSNGLVQAVPALRESGLKLTTAVLIHDVIPVIFPEFFRQEDANSWSRNLPLLVRMADVILVSSDNTAADVKEVKPELAPLIRKIRFGDAFDLPSGSGTEDGQTLSRLGLDQRYVLIVGTIEVRKNHQLALRAWRNLARQRPGAMPLLVFAGKWGWKTGDLRDQIQDSGNLDGLVKVVDGPSDAEMVALYRGALFTLYPSLYEGWGLPVRESLAYRKVCLAARNSSIPEAGGVLADYFESNCEGDLEAQLERLLFDETAREDKEARIGEEFQPNSWEKCWAGIKSLLPIHDTFNQNHER